MMHMLKQKTKVFHVYTLGKLKKLYGWVLHWGKTKYAVWALFFISFIESSFFPIPPDVLLLCMGIAKPKRSFWYALLTTVASVLGGVFGYFIGFALYESMGQRLIAALGQESTFALVGQLFAENAFLAILGAAVTPIPYKVFTIAAGVWHIPLTIFIIASIVGRGIRYFLLATLLYFFGERIKYVIERYFNWIMLGIFIVIVVLVLLVKIYG